MKNVKNNPQVEKAAGQSAVTMKSKGTSGSLNEERWLTAPGKNTKSQSLELGRQKRTW